MLRIYKAEFSKKVKNIEARTKNCNLIKKMGVFNSVDQGSLMLNKDTGK